MCGSSGERSSLVFDSCIGVARKKWMPGFSAPKGLRTERVPGRDQWIDCVLEEAQAGYADGRPSAKRLALMFKDI
jgi:hypothetical protein